MKKLNLTYGDKSQDNSLIDELKTNNEVKAYLKSKSYDSSLLNDNPISFFNWLKDNAFCKECKDLAMCNKSSKGYHIDVDEKGLEVIVPCKYLVERNKKYAHKDNYLICDLSDSALTNDIDKIDLENENSVYCTNVDNVKSWINRQPVKGFYFHGGLGVGKTYLASCISNGLAKKGKKVAFVNFPRLANDLRNNMTEEYYVENKVRKMRQAYLLVIDDIGAENITNWIRDDILFTVLDYRMENKKRTIFTSNSDLETLQKRLANASPILDSVKAERVMERIKTLSLVLEVDGKSRRDRW